MTYFLLFAKQRPPLHQRNFWSHARKFLGFVVFLLVISVQNQALAIQASTSQDKDGNIQFIFNDSPSIKIAAASNTVGGSCSELKQTAGALRYNLSIKNIEFCDGSTWRVIGSSGGLKSIKTFTTSGTWTKPSGVTRVFVKVIGGGGGGGSRNLYFVPAGSSGSIGPMGGGGGSGGYCERVIDVATISSIPVSVGAGGVGVAIGTGGNGGTSAFGGYCTATGGNGGTGRGYSGSGGSAMNGDINISGGSGKPAHHYGYSGAGAEGPWGGAGLAQTLITEKGPGNVEVETPTPATSGTSPGAGGGGTAPELSVGPSGSGANGIVIVYEYE